MAKFALTLTILLTGIHLTLFAQREIKGMAYDKDTRKPLEGATVLLFTAEKSILKGQSQSDRDGNFLVKNVPPGNFVLTISYMGYTAATIHLSANEKGKVSQPTIQQTGLQRNAISLSSVNIKITKPAFIIRKDTIEFSAGDFQTAENASLKNLLQKIPGLTVDADGNFFYQGKPIKELYIDGRSVFQNTPNSSGDPQKVSRMLLANLVDKIQVADKKGLDGMIEGGKNEKVINITIKKEMKKGVNGTVGAGYGTDDRFNVAGNANMFRDNKQVIAMATRNNVNSSRGPSSTDENLSRAENYGGLAIRSNASGNISLDIAKKVKLNANLIHFDNQINNDQFQQRDNILPDSNFRYNSTSKNATNTSFNNMYANVMIQPNDENFISVDLMGSLQKNQPCTENKYISLGGKNNDTINMGNTINKETRKNSALSIGTTFIHMFDKKWGNTNFNINVEQNNTRDNQSNYNLNFVPASDISDTINQQLAYQLNTRKITTGLSYQYPITPVIFLSLGYRYTNNLTQNDQQAFDFDGIKRGYSILNKTLTYDFQNRYTVNAFSTGITINKNNLQGQLLISYNNTNSISNNYTDGKEYRQKVNYFAPNLFLSYKIDNYKTFSANISRETRVPNTGTMLVPVVSIRNPLYVQLGNPDLKPTIYNNGSIGYRSYSVKGLTFGTNLSVDIPENVATQSIYSDSSGRQISQPINVNGTYSINQDITLGKRFNKSGITLNYTLGYNFSHTNTFVNQLKNTTSSFGSMQVLTGSWTYKKLLELEGMFCVMYNGNAYSIQDNAYYDYLNYNLSLSANTYLPFNINFGVGTTYYNNTSQRQQYVVVNTWVSKTCLPDKSLQVKLYVYDLFRENQALLTMQTFTYIEQQRNSILARYAMLSVSYFFGKKKPATGPQPPQL
ncbi:outer membrane beta-barrel protein [Chitinophaga sp. RAB17]|uniref:outer membrane beta-barrel protein n=1 Tax=Chitinophaga sp. RAB17 TaxID=3233049 RepID=UPI003F93088F